MPDPVSIQTLLKAAGATKLMRRSVAKEKPPEDPVTAERKASLLRIAQAFTDAGRGIPSHIQDELRRYQIMPKPDAVVDGSPPRGFDSSSR